MRFLRALPVLSLALLAFFQGCETLQSDAEIRRQAMNASIKLEPPGDYFIARRLYKKHYKMWGWVREPGKPWNAAKLVMLNEQKMLAPDRAANNIGYDNNFEYKFTGYFSGDMVYEPASDGFYPEFVLTGYELRSMSPPLIYRTERQLDPEARILMRPY